MFMDGSNFQRELQQNMRPLLSILLLLVLTPSSSQSQYTHKLAGYEDPEELAIKANRQRLEQDQKNIANQEFVIAEFESQARKVSRNLEVLSCSLEYQQSPKLMNYQAEIYKDLQARQRQIDTMKQWMETARRLLQESTRQVNEQEVEYKRRKTNNDPQSAELPIDKWGDEIRERNERLIKEAAEREKDGAAQNAHRITQVSGEKNPFPAGQPPQLSPVLRGDAPDAAELALCELLEKKASEPNPDIAEINLLAAKGLPGTENLDVEKTLKTLDLWAAWVKHETDRHLYKYNKAPEEYNNSEAFFRILVMVCTLQEDFKICYNKDPKMRAGPVEVVPNDFTFFGNPRDLFIHGLTEGEHEGTCASLPVLYVAVGRRLGYPLKLVECKGHLFVRWEDNKERFNIEGTNRGLNCYPDQEYMEWPWPISKEEQETGMYMKSMSSRREVSAFLELRSLCLKQNKHEKQHQTVKLFADNLRKREGVDLDKLNRLMRHYASSSADGTVESVLMYQTLTNTNSWRAPGDERGAPGKHTVFAADRFDSK
jgi:hypothetical protein